MNSSQEVQSHPNRRYRKKIFLVFKENRYPADFISLLNNSEYFCERMSEFQNINEIQLQDEPIDITKESFDIFLDFCHDEINEDKINEENIFQLQQLAKTYSVSTLARCNEAFLNNHPNISLQSVLFNDTTNEETEKFISEHFLDFVDNDRLLTIPIPVLHRIINMKELNINELNETDQKTVINFLLKYLRHNGKQSSVLFTNIDVDPSKFDLVSTLLNEYSDIIDFNMIDSNLQIKTIEKMRKTVSTLTEAIDEQKLKQQDLNDENNLNYDEVAKSTSVCDLEPHLESANRSDEPSKTVNLSFSTNSVCDVQPDLELTKKRFKEQEIVNFKSSPEMTTINIPFV